MSPLNKRDEEWLHILMACQSVPGLRVNQAVQKCSGDNPLRVCGNVAQCSEGLSPTGSEERGVLGVGSIHGAILPFCQYMINIALQVHTQYSWLVKIRNTSEVVLRPQYTPWPSY